MGDVLTQNKMGTCSVPCIQGDHPGRSQVGCKQGQTPSPQPPRIGAGLAAQTDISEARQRAPQGRQPCGWWALDKLSVQWGLQLAVGGTLSPFTPHPCSCQHLPALLLFCIASPPACPFHDVESDHCPHVQWVELCPQKMLSCPHPPSL